MQGASFFCVLLDLEMNCMKDVRRVKYLFKLIKLVTICRENEPLKLTETGFQFLVCRRPVTDDPFHG